MPLPGEVACSTTEPREPGTTPAALEAPQEGAETLKREVTPFPRSGSFTRVSTEMRALKVIVGVMLLVVLGLAVLCGAIVLRSTNV